MSKLPSIDEEFATNVVRQLRTAGHESLFAGGCVRDRLLGITPKDFDVATSALPDQVRDVFGHRRTIAVGASFGVITVLGPKPQQVEVATFRNDGSYSDGRHPDSVEFSTAEEDALRRDFTINGMFFDPIEERVIDYVGGQSDLQTRMIRAIGDPLKRIEEDRLRMLRAVRFSSTFDFAFEESTLAAIQQQHVHISDVSQERITHELQRMLTHRHRRRALELLGECRLLECILPELHAVSVKDAGRWEQLLKIAESLASPARIELVLSLLLGEHGLNLQAKQVDLFCRALKLSNEVRKTTKWVTETLPQFRVAASAKFSQLQPILIHEDIEQLLQLAETVASVDDDSARLVQVHACRAKLALPRLQLDPEPLIRGEDLGELGISPGPAFAKMLATVRAAQLDGEVETKSTALALLRSQIADGVW